MKRDDALRPNRLQHIPADTEEEIRLRAYELYEERGKVDGFEVEDWLRAEAEIRGIQESDQAA